MEGRFREFPEEGSLLYNVDEALASLLQPSEIVSALQFAVLTGSDGCSYRFSAFRFHVVK